MISLGKNKNFIFGGLGTLVAVGILLLDKALPLGVADGVLKTDGEPIYEAKDMKVGLFQSDNK